MNRITLSLIYLAFIFLLIGCSENKLSPLGQNATILAFGDSLTFGVGARLNESYPKILAELTNLNVVNAGISGETTAQGLARFSSQLDKYQPQLVILLEGGNDILRGHDLNNTKQNLALMISLAKERQIELLLIGVPEKKLFSNSADLYDQLADEYNVAYEGKLLSELLKTPKYKSDMIHLNAKGYREFALRIAEILKDNGAL